VIVAKSLATDKRRVNINTLYAALFADLPTPKDFKVPTQAEIRERKLQELIRKINKPIAFFIDGAHDLHWRTLIGLKQLIETIEDAKGTLTIIMVAPPNWAMTSTSRPWKKSVRGLNCLAWTVGDNRKNAILNGH
jgi:type II secretory pathway predicted ATPase ExeA